MSHRNSLLELAGLFFKLGSIAFGGPAAHIAMMEDEVVRKRKWMTQDHFLDLIGATNLIPGPNSTEMTMHCGHERAGWTGLVVAGVCFIFPAVVITSIFAWLYEQYGTLPQLEPFIYGIKPAVIAIILTAAFRLGKKALKDMELAIMGILATVAVLSGLNEILTLFGTGFLGWIRYSTKKKNKGMHGLAPFLAFQMITSMKIGSLKIFLTFLKVGAILYGSGYVLFALLDSELVARGWLSREVLIDSVAVGQMTPGPVLSTATFIGWQMNGLEGAVLATVGIFLPSFFFVLLLNPLVPKMRKSKLVGAVLDAVNVAAVALIFAVCIQMGIDTLTDWRTSLIAIISLIILFTFRTLSSVFAVLGGATLGYLLSFI